MGRTAQLVSGFDSYLGAFTQRPPFVKGGQFEHHAETIRLRRELGTVAAAVASERFVGSLHATLRAWGIGVRASSLVEPSNLQAELNGSLSQLEALEGVQLADAGRSDRNAVWGLIQSLAITGNRARLVALTKTLHHLLPDLVPPIDRAYTGLFLGFHQLAFQNDQSEIFEAAWTAFQEVARQVDLNSYVGRGWNTSTTKAIDNAIVGFCMQEQLAGDENAPKAATRGRNRVMNAGVARRTSWTITDLQEDLEVFAGELAQAGLKENTINTYVGRSETFLRWLEGRYVPQGPNT